MKQPGILKTYESDMSIQAVWRLIPAQCKDLKTYSKDFRSVYAIIRDSCFQYVDTTEEGDLAKVSKAENCQHWIYELKRIEHFKVLLSMADDKLVDISTVEKDIFCKRIFPLVANLKEKVQSLVNLLKTCQFSDVQLRESIDSIKASCMGLFEVLDDLKLPPVFLIQCDLTDAGLRVGVSNFLVHFRDTEHARMYGSIYRITVHLSRGDSGQNEAERTNGTIADNIFDGGTLPWENEKRFEGMSEEDIEETSS